MDPNHADSSLQKTSPNTDPATVHQLSTELSAQASVLATHQQQLNRLTTLTEELVKMLQALCTSSAEPAISRSSSPTHAAAHTATTISPRLAFPDKFAGTPAKCKGFLLQCSMFVYQQPALYPTDQSRIAFVCSLLSGRALDWATAVWREDRVVFLSFAAFLQSFKEVFEYSADGKEVGEQLLQLRQGKNTVADYALAFRTLAAQTGWPDDPLKLLFCKGLNAELESELACRDEGKSLAQFIDLAIRVDNLVHARRPQRPLTSSVSTSSQPSESEPMQLGVMHIRSEERERRIQKNLGLYRGLPGHMRSSCPMCPSRKTAAVSSGFHSPSRTEIPVILKFSSKAVHTTALIDSGAAGNFIDREFARTHSIPLVLCASYLAVAAVDVRPLGSGQIQHTTDDLILCSGALHTETIRLFVISTSQTPIILGFPWLEKHNPVISWTERQILRWSEPCQQQCLSQMPPKAVSDGSLITSPDLAKLPREYWDLAEAFSKTKASQLPPHRSTDCAIDLVPGSHPPKGCIFPLSQPESAAMKAYIDEELKKGFIRPSTSPASAGLNEITVKFRYPLPLVLAALEQLRTAKFFTKLDLHNAYNLIRIREGDEWKTGFSTTTGHYEYLVMPFGLVNSQSVFQAFINDVFRDMLNRWVIVYIDDIIIYSDSFQEHVNHVRSVLQRLMQHQLYAKLEKCEFHLTKISFLGYIISPEGVAMDDSKVCAAVNWPQPATIKELQHFLGFAKFYRRFIRNFSSITAPLTTMIKGGRQRLTWTPSAITAFQELKNRFTTAPILHHPDPDLEFIVEVDASNTGIGAVLSQRQGDSPKMYPCAFYSHKLTPTEQNYDAGNRELLAMKAAFEEWRHWLEGAKHLFTVLMDHRNLEYLRSAKRLNHRQASFTVTYRPGSQNTKADALSGLHESQESPSSNEPILSSSIIVAPVQWDITTEIAEAPLTDPPPAECPPNRTYVPQALRQRLLQLVHATPSSGHPGITATTQLLTNRYWWPSLQSDTISFKDCTICNTSKSAHPAGLLQPLPIPRRPWSHIAIDFGIPPSSVIDRFSKACRFIPLPKLPSALETAEALCNQVFRFYGLPEDILSDCGPQFTSRVWASFCKLLNINVSLTSGYHPESNGQAERLNQELTRFLRSYCQWNQSDWSRYLLWAEYAQNSLHKPSTNLTPFQCILGFQPPLFPWSGKPSELPAVDSWLQQSEETWDQAHVHLQRAVRRTREQADRHRRPNPAYHPGQWVWLSTRDLRLWLPRKKLSPRYVGPFKILREITPVSFKLALPHNYRISPTFHVSWLKPAGGSRGVEDQEEAGDQSTPPLIVDGEEAYQVHEILDSPRRAR
ncbi:hypothetical protein M9458_026070, partial [Cirrhinus mrigala]